MSAVKGPCTCAGDCTDLPHRPDCPAFDERWDATATRILATAPHTRPIEDVVNAPAHYTSGGIECIDYLKAKMSSEEFAGFLRGNVLKYLSRAGLKSNRLEDLKKAAWYLERLIREGE